MNPYAAGIEWSTAIGSTVKSPILILCPVLNLWNGMATLTATLPDDAKVEEIIVYKSIVGDDTQLNPFEDAFKVKVLDEAIVSPGGPTT